MSAETLDAYRRAGLGVYLLAGAEAERSALAGTSAGDVRDATRCFLLCTWNAFALQTLGDAFVDADYEADPRTVGFVPPPLALPAELPACVEVEPCPSEHLQAMLGSSPHPR